VVAGKKYIKGEVFARIIVNDDLTDIVDGVVYQKLIKSGFLSCNKNITLILNTDGVPVFQSSSFTFWLIYIFINELPFRIRSHRYICCYTASYNCLHYRIAKQNRIITGLWYGKIKPDMSLF